MRQVAAELQPTKLDGIIATSRLSEIVSDASAAMPCVRAAFLFNNSPFT